MKQQVKFLIAVMCLAVHSIHAMNNMELLCYKVIMDELKPTRYMEQWPEHFKKLVCLKFDKEALLDANPFWKHVSEHESKGRKDSYLLEALYLPGGDPVWMPHRKAIVCALAAGADSNVMCWDGDLALGKAVLMNDYPLVKFVLKCGAKPNIRWHGEPLLFYAESLNVAKLLIEYKADVFWRDFMGDTVLHEVTDNDISADLISYYVKQGCDVNARNNYGFTPIMRIVSVFFDTIKFRAFLEAGADVTLQNKHGDTVWDIARRNRCLEQAQKIYELYKRLT